MTRMRGTIRSVTNKGYGFITPADGSADVFLHANNLDLDQQFDERLVGKTVEFETEAGRGKSPSAINATLVEP